MSKSRGIMFSKFKTGPIPREMIALLLIMVFTSISTSSIRAAQLPDLSGKWKINTELSDDAKKKLENVLPPLSMVGRTGGPVGQNEDPRDREREQTRRRIEALIEASETLDITQLKNEVTVVEGELRERKFYADGRPSQRQDRRGNLSTTRTRWRGERLVVETKLADGGRFTESYELAPGGKQLFVTITSQDQRLKQPLVIRRVYDKAQLPPG